ncbi:MAG: hypothetical protein QOF82_327 [Frankiales bacterium]|nr:hypothetical protein [Frankiales bacterium]
MTLRSRTQTRCLALAVSAAVALTTGCTAGSSKAQPPDTGTASLTTFSQAAAASAAAAPPAAAAAKTAAKHPVAYWPTYHRVSARTGVDPTSPKLGKTSTVWSRRLDGAVYASPLIVGNTVIAATENNTVYALRGGHTVWSRHLGKPVALASLPCGNINPLGITGTPVYDGSSGIVYVAAELAGPLRHTLYAIDAVTGKVLWHRGLDVKGMDPRVQQQRGALTLANGTVYVPLGGLAGDCGDYHGWVIGYQTTGAGPLVYKTEDTEAGIWAPSGLAVAPGGNLLASVGNSGHTQASQGYDHSDAILSLSPTLKLTDYFSPTTWAEDNAHDLDLSSMGPAYLPGGKVFIAGKRGVAYLTSVTHLGHVGGQLSSLSGCAAYGGTAYYQGVVFAPCSDGLAAIAISGNRMHVLWKARSNITGSPIYGGGAVWTLDYRAGVVYGLDRSTGKVLRTVHVGETSRFATMAMVHGYLHVPTLTGVVAIRTG